MYPESPLSMRCTEGSTDKMRIYEVTGPITLANLFGFQDQLRASEPPERVVLDLAGVPYVDSAGLGAIVNYFVHCERRGTRMALAGVSDRIAEMLRMTRVDAVIPVVSKAEDGF